MSERGDGTDEVTKYCSTAVPKMFLLFELVWGACSLTFNSVRNVPYRFPLYSTCDPWRQAVMQMQSELYQSDDWWKDTKCDYQHLDFGSDLYSRTTVLPVSSYDLSKPRKRYSTESWIQQTEWIDFSSSIIVYWADSIHTDVTHFRILLISNG